MDGGFDGGVGPMDENNALHRGARKKNAMVDLSGYGEKRGVGVGCVGGPAEARMRIRSRARIYSREAHAGEKLEYLLSALSGRTNRPGGGGDGDNNVASAEFFRMR